MAQQLLRISGQDSAGITAALMHAVNQSQVKILDIEQAVTHGVLGLFILLDCDDAKVADLDKNLKNAVAKFTVDVRLEPVTGPYTISDPAHRFVLTALADEIPTPFLAEITTAIAGVSANIDGIRRLNSGQLATLELTCSSPEKIQINSVKERLLAIASRYPGVDLAVQKENIYRRSKRLVVFDMDSTLIQGEVIDELAHIAGKFSEVSALTKRAMNGEMDFQESLIRRVSMLKGLQKQDLEKVYNNIQLTPGVPQLIHALKRLGYKIAVISGGFTFFTERLKQDLGLHYAYANTLEFDGDEITGRLQGIIVDGQRKADLLDLLAQQEGALLDQVIAIGDGANDMQMLKKAGLGIAFNAKAFTKKAIGTSITHKRMDSILYLLGISDADLASINIGKKF